MAVISFKAGIGNVNVLEQIGRKYTTCGPLLLNDTTAAVIEAIEEQCHHDATNIKLRILQRWMKGEGIKLVTWSTLTKVLRDVGLSELAREIEQNL